MTEVVDEKLRLEILNLFQYVQRLRQEIAGVSKRDDDQTAFDSMSEQLDAIVAATEKATNTILEAAEAMCDAAEELRGTEDAEARGKLCDRITGESSEIMQACAFQDITGQRVSKIVSSMRFVEERVSVMAEIWGREEIEELAETLPTEEKTGDEALLHGPQLPDEAISQDEIDKLFA
jgi:chemotaxis protein CheZ